jgi:hypothetical protein
MAKVHFLSIPDATFAEILTIPELDHLNYLTRFYFWQHMADYKITMRESKPEKLIQLLNIHNLSYCYSTFEFSEDAIITTTSFKEEETYVKLPF